MSDIDYKKLLSDPFEEGDVEWRIQSSGKTGERVWIKLIPYITSRGVQQRLDDVFGIDGWQNELKETSQGFICGISVKIADKWITKWDGAPFTSIESLKGSISGALKRAAVLLGIGRYLYHLDIVWAECKVCDDRWSVDRGWTYVDIKIDKYNKSKDAPTIPYQWKAPGMPDWAMPSAKSDTLIDNIKKATDVITMRVEYEKAYKYANSFNRGDLLKKIIETKNARKDFLEGESQAETSEDERKIREWLEISVTDHLFGAANESVLKVAKKNISEQLKQKSIEHDVDIMEMMKVLEGYYQKQLNKLNYGAKL